jgi:hypothetical protein
MEVLATGGNPMHKRYIVRLEADEREQLANLVKNGKSAAYRIKHANILLMVDASAEAWSDDKTAQALHCHTNTVRNVRQRFVEQGLEAALERKKQEKPSRSRCCDGETEARLIALSCSQPPTGHGKWSVRLLADKMVELEVVQSISHETVRQTLKKTS